MRNKRVRALRRLALVIIHKDGIKFQPEGQGFNPYKNFIRKVRRSV